MPVSIFGESYAGMCARLSRRYYCTLLHNTVYYCILLYHCVPGLRGLPDARRHLRRIVYRNVRGPTRHAAHAHVSTPALHYYGTPLSTVRPYSRRTMPVSGESYLGIRAQSQTPRFPKRYRPCLPTFPGTLTFPFAPACTPPSKPPSNPPSQVRPTLHTSFHTNCLLYIYTSEWPSFTPPSQLRPPLHISQYTYIILPSFAPACTTPSAPRSQFRPALHTRIPTCIPTPQVRPTARRQVARRPGDGPQRRAAEAELSVFL